MSSPHEELSTAMTHCLQNILNAISELEKFKAEREKHEARRKACPGDRLRAYPFLWEKLGKIESGLHLLYSSTSVPPHWLPKCDLSRKVVSGDRFSYLKCRSCRKCVVCHDRWSLMAVISQERFHCISLRQVDTESLPIF